jgi:hypothetical protein
MKIYTLIHAHREIPVADNILICWKVTAHEKEDEWSQDGTV